jgi:hypothetical protein
MGKKELAMEREPLIVQYTNLLHQHQAPNAPAVLRFYEQHKHNTVFAARAQKLNALYVMHKLRTPAGGD